MSSFAKLTVTALVALILGVYGWFGLAAGSPPDSDPSIANLDRFLIEDIQFRLTENPNQELPKLVEELAHPDFEIRERSTKRLIETGPLSLPHLYQAELHSDSEVQRRTQICLNAIRSKWCLPNTFQLSEAIRVGGRIPSAGFVQRLFQLLPVIQQDQGLVLEIWFTLDAIAAEHNSWESICRVELRNPDPLRRALAGYLLARRGSDADRSMAQEALTDSDPQVRLRIAQGLLGSGQLLGVPTLIELLAQPSVVEAWQAEELLRWIAGSSAPESLILAGQDAERCRDDWVNWWNRSRGQLDFDDFSTAPRRPILLLLDLDTHHGETLLCGSDGLPRWQFPLRFSRIDEFLPGNRVLVMCRVPPNTPNPLVSLWPISVSECQIDGKMIWQFPLTDSPIESLNTLPNPVRRIANGETLFADSWRILFLDHRGNPDLDERITYRTLNVAKRESEGNPLWGGIHQGLFRYALPTLDYGQPFWTVDYNPLTGEVVPRGSTDRLLPNVTPGRSECLVRSERGWQLFDDTGNLIRTIPERYEDLTLLRNGALIALDSQRSHLLELDHEGGIVWEAPAGRGSHQVKSVRVVFELLRLGFGDLPRRSNLEDAYDFRVQELRHPDQRRRYLAARAFSSEFNRSILETAPALIEAVGDELLTAPKTSPAAFEMGSSLIVGATLGSELPLWNQDSPWNVLGALQEPILSLDPGALTPILTQSAQDFKASSRAGAIYIMGCEVSRGVSTDEALFWEAVVRALDDEISSVRFVALTVLPEFAHTHAEEVVFRLRKALEDHDTPIPGKPSVSVQAAVGLGTIARQGYAKEAALAIDELLNAARHTDPRTRRASLVALAEIGRRNPVIVPNLFPLYQELLQGTQPVKLDTIESFAKLGSAGKVVVPLLIQSVSDWPRTTDCPTREAVLNAFRAIGSSAESATPLVIDIGRRASSFEDRQQALTTIGVIGVNHPATQSFLIDLTQDQDRELASGAQEMLHRLNR